MLWGQELELAMLLFTYSYTESPQGTRQYYTPIGIMRNGSEFTEKLQGQDEKYGL